MILGLEFRAVPVSVEDNYALRGEALREVMLADRDKGYVPFFVGELHGGLKWACEPDTHGQSRL